tara:strand:+ start:25912 stop:26391 length:480 start_codon:yes stop_codon:yes gene_type:complete
MLQQVQGFSHFRLSTMADVQYLAPRLRHADKQEILANSGSFPIHALTKGYYLSDIIFTIVNPKNEPVGIFGVTDIGSGVGSIWLLATDNLSDIKLSFLRECKKVINFLNTKYKILWNFVDCRNSLHIKWLKWCGFQFINKQPYGVSNKPFYEFIKINYV